MGETGMLADLPILDQDGAAGPALRISATRAPGRRWPAAAPLAAAFPDRRSAGFWGWRIRHLARNFGAYWRRCDAPRRPIDWLGLAIFLVVACLWSWLAVGWGPLRLPGGGDAPRIDPLVLIGFGPMFGAMAAGTVRQTLPDWPAGFRGLAKRWAMLAAALPVIALGLVGTPRFHIDPHLDAAAIGLSLLVACAAEEVGWREWLYNALGGLPLWASALATWAAWLGWHVVVATGDRFATPYGLVDALALLIASFVLAVIVRETRSAAIAAAWRVTAILPLEPWQLAALALAVAAATWKAAVETRTLALAYATP